MLRRLIGIAVMGVVIVGCQSAKKPATVEVAPAQAPVAAADSSSATSTPALAEFQPPFPNRTELFEPPRRGQGTVRRDDEHGETIELKGFVNVNGPQVVLAIDGVISPIPAGGEKYGVQVISIDPPHAVLQRGRNRWTASLE